MPSAVAFFPWLVVDEPFEVGPFRLLPYVRGKRPGNLRNVTQKVIDGVLGAYANLPSKNVKKASILELGEWKTGDDAEKVIADLFKARNYLAFSSLANRKLFRGHFGYCNYDCFNLIVQRYSSANPGIFSFSTRRRDGGTSQMWSSTEFAFHRPNHVDAHTTLSADEVLLNTLLMKDGITDSQYEALLEFNCANTDSPDVPTHVEVVMMKSAFEWLLKIDEKANHFSAALENILDGMTAAMEFDGPLNSAWRQARPKAKRPLEAWAREFCDLRGVSAHGKPRDTRRFVWDVHSHLAFASFLFPLIFKKVIAERGLMKIDAYDTERLKVIDMYIMHAPFMHDWRKEGANHPWVDIDAKAFANARAPLFYAIK